MAIAERYKAVDVHGADDGSIWPTSLPELTGPEAIRAARRMYRFSMGRTFDGRFVLTSGRRYNWIRRGVWYLNPGRGWKHLVHDSSHYFVHTLNPDERPHSKFHSRFELKLAREVVRRGWLDGKLRDKPAAAKVAVAPGPDDKRRDKLSRIEARIVSWERKEKRARKALAKLAKQRRYYVKALGIPE